MKPLPPEAAVHLQAAQGWTELGNPSEANLELEQIAPELRNHPDVLEVRWEIEAKAKRWEACIETAEALIRLAPEREVGWIHRSYALHELKRTQEALDKLWPASAKWPEHPMIAYNIACYLCQLGKLQEAKFWIGWAMSLGEEKEIRAMAREDPDLAPIRRDI